MGQCFAIVRLKEMQTLKIIIKRLQIDYFSGHAKKSQFEVCNDFIFRSCINRERISSTTDQGIITFGS